MDRVRYMMKLQGIEANRNDCIPRALRSVRHGNNGIGAKSHAQTTVCVRTYPQGRRDHSRPHAPNGGYGGKGKGLLVAQLCVINARFFNFIRI